MQDPDLISVAAWHYNLRDKTRWPDLKTLQQRWHIAVALMALCALLGLGFGYTAWQYGHGVLKGRHLRQQIEALSKTHEACLQRNALFGQKAHVICDVRNVYDPSFNPIEGILLVSKTLPSEMVLQTLIFKENQNPSPAGTLQRQFVMKLEGYLEGSEEEGLKILESMRQSMERETTAGAPLCTFRVESLRRELTGSMAGALHFEIDLRWEATSAVSPQFHAANPEPSHGDKAR